MPKKLKAIIMEIKAAFGYEKVSESMITGTWS